MKSALLSLHPQNYASQRLLSEANFLGVKLDVINPKDFCVSPELGIKKYDFTLNRISLVEMNSFYHTLLRQKYWGTQTNCLELKLKWQDKAHQLTWLQEFGFQTIPFFLVQGNPALSQNSLETFLQTHNSSGWMLKMNRGQRGVGVHVLRENSEVTQWLETLWRMGDQDFILQPRLNLIHEWRVSLVGTEFVCVLKRSHHLGKANAHSDQKVEWVKEVPTRLKDLIERFKKSQKFDYLALDILEDESGLYINDLNTTMGFEQLEKITGYNISKLILEQSIRASH